MDNPSILLRAGNSGEGFAPSTPGYVLVIDSDGQSVKPRPSTASAPQVVRVGWALSKAQLTFESDQTGPIFAVVTQISGALAPLATGDTLMMPPYDCYVGGYHFATAAPQYGGAWLVVEKLDDDNMLVQRIAELSTSAQIDALGLITADAGAGAGVYQVTTPLGGTINVDAQVMPLASPLPPSMLWATAFFDATAALTIPMGVSSLDLGNPSTGSVGISWNGDTTTAVPSVYVSASWNTVPGDVQILGALVDISGHFILTVYNFSGAVIVNASGVATVTSKPAP